MDDYWDEGVQARRLAYAGKDLESGLTTLHEAISSADAHLCMLHEHLINHFGAGFDVGMEPSRSTKTIPSGVTPQCNRVALAVWRMDSLISHLQQISSKFRD